jgi:hypothetical protein
MGNIGEAFSESIAAEERVLSAKMEAVSAALSHPGAKGSVAENEVVSLFRSFLPAEYGIGTGFIAHHGNCVTEVKNPHTGKACPSYSAERDIIQRSGQLDLIIYDALRYSPIINLGTQQVYPIEGVYAYVEVKKTLLTIPDKNGRTPLQRILEQSDALRKIKTRFAMASVPGTFTKMTPAVLYDALSIRSFVFIFDTDEELGSANQINGEMERLAKQHGGFISEMYIRGKGHFRSRHREPGPATDDSLFDPVIEEKPLVSFKNAVLSSLSRFSRMDTYLEPHESGETTRHLHPATYTYFSGEPVNPQICLRSGPPL